ncbi:MAG: hypothetical protein FWH37_03285 [Candidatus Bathyarchaeota archaeon]|nr:hypothetical protein [Candidatus Termiticorpusculum sp.]
MRNVSNNSRKVTTMKPYPIPTLSRKAVKELERDINEGPTELQKEMMKQATTTFAKTKRR